MGPLLESPPRLSLKSGLQPLGRYGTHQGTISRRAEQLDVYSGTRLEWLGEGLLFKLDSNKRWRAEMQPIFESFPGPLLKSGVRPLARYGNHQETISLHLTQNWSGPGRGHYSSWTQINARGQNRATIRVTSQAIIEVRSAALVQIWHPPDHKWET